MGKYHDLVAGVGTGEDGGVLYPETFLADLDGAYNDDFAGAQASEQMLQAQLAEKDAVIQQLQAANWQLLQQIPTNNTVEEPAAEEGEGDGGEDDPEADVKSPDEFFSKAE